MKPLALVVLALLVSCAPTVTPSTDGQLRLIAERGEVRLEAVAPMLWARVALRGTDIVSPYCELPECAAEQGVTYLALPPEAGPYPVVQPVATYGTLSGGAAVTTLQDADESFTAQLERR